MEQQSSSEEYAKKEDFTPYEYQTELLEECRKRNCIVFLPTGSGKTYIAVMLIKCLSQALEKTIEEGGQRTFFLVNTVALVTQQADYIRRHSYLTIGTYSGEMKVDFWKRNKWIEEINTHQVLVMTCQIFYDILVHNYISFKNINLMIFDECHHAVGDAPMSKVMQLYKCVPQEERPKVLGLTATLLNANCPSRKVLSSVETLENTFDSKVISSGRRKEISRYSTNPIERLIYYKPAEISEEVNRAKDRINAAIAHINDFNFPDSVYELVPDTLPNEAKLMKDSRKINKKLCNIFKDVIKHFEELGLFGGQLACIVHIIQLERIRKRLDDFTMSLLFQSLITTLTAVRKEVEDFMSRTPPTKHVLTYSSPKVHVLLQLLKEEIVELGENADTKLSALIFVERRFTAKILYHILQFASRLSNSGLDVMKPDFMVGFQNNPYNQTREGQLDAKWCYQAMKRFRGGDSNVLVSSNVLEEGIDISEVNLVIRFDPVTTFRSYIQSKGRARNSKSKFLVLSPDDAILPKLGNFKEVEKELKKILYKDVTSSSDDSEEASEESEEIYYPTDEKGAKLTYYSAISVINRYCGSLPQDKFAPLVAIPYVKEEENLYKCYLLLPSNSAVKHYIEGKWKKTKKLAKKSVSFEGSKILHQLGELSDNLLPNVRTASSRIDLMRFPLLQKEKAPAESKEIPGTKQRRQTYEKEYPQEMIEGLPMPGQTTFLHVLKLRPQYQKPASDDSRRLTFYELLNLSDDFAIISAKPFPKVCSFPVFMNVGELKATILPNASQLTLSSSEIEEIQNFSSNLFVNVLRLCKTFIIRDLENKENSFLIVPVYPKNSNHVYDINWTVVREHSVIPQVFRPFDDEERAVIKPFEDYNRKIVTPWYRTLPPETMYIVTKVCSDMSPASTFPNDDIASYEEYFKTKYDLKVTIPNEPLLEVRAISNRINFLRPRGCTQSSLAAKRKRQELQEDFEEHLIPEFCAYFNFPSVLWLKATCLPSVIHRLTYILFAEGLRREIAADLGIGVDKLPGEKQWDDLQVDEDFIPGVTPVHKTYINAELNSAGYRKAEPLPDLEVESEPVDIDRVDIRELSFIDVWNFVEYTSKPLIQKKFLTSQSKRSDEILSENVLVPKIKVLGSLHSSFGIQQGTLLQALTTAGANDIFNLERLETLGDSFLKFAVSLFLYVEYPNFNEGILTDLKGQLVGNKHLYICGKERRLGGKIKLQDFAPRSDFMPPNFAVPREVQHLVRDNDIAINILYELSVMPEEQISGIYEPIVIEIFKEKAMKWEKNIGLHGNMESFIGIQTLPDKTIADCVEAIIGSCVKEAGSLAALKLLSWFKILPDDPDLPQKLLYDKPLSPLIPREPPTTSADVNYILGNTSVLEKKINYKFKNRSYLLQALSHPSVTHRLTECYQRLEFLGDAILDYLITCYIYENCGKLSPGELTDLRSALVNNVTFAALAVRYGFHKELKHASNDLFQKIDAFVKQQEENGHQVSEEVLLLLDERDTAIVEAIDIPKALGDLFESIAAAIYLDSNKSLETVWEVYYRLMKDEFREFAEKVPKQPVRMLYEKCRNIKFSKPVAVPDRNVTTVCVEVFTRNGHKAFHGFGKNKYQAKRAAAKVALKQLEEEDQYFLGRKTV